MKKQLLLLAMLLGTVGAWAQKLVTSVQEGMYYTLECNSTEDHLTSRFLGENVLGLNGKSAKPAYLIFEPTEGGYHVKSALTGKYLNQGEVISEGSKYAVAYETEAKTVWTIGKLADDATDVYLNIVESKFYLNNNYTGTQQLQIVKHDAISTGNACSLWEMREHEGGYKVIESIGENITDLSQLTDGSYVAFYNVGKQKYIYEGIDHKLYMGTAATVDAGHEYIWRVRKEGDKYAFMSVSSGRYFSSPLDGQDVFTCGIDNSAKDEFTITAHTEDNTKWLIKSSNINKWWDAQDARFVGWDGNGTNSRYEIKPVNVKNLEHDLAAFITTDENIIKWVNIKNVRSGKYATYEGESTKMTQKDDKTMSKAFFYMTGTLSTAVDATVKATVKIHNFATENLCAEYNSWTTAGTNWNIMASQGQNIHPGWAISKGTDLNNGNAWNNEGGGGSTIAYWNGNDQGSTWAFETADYYALNSKLEGLKGDLQTVVDQMTEVYEGGNVTENPVTLSANEGDDGYLYCNAAGENNSYETDRAGVAALIDGKDGTFLHTDYTGADSKDGLDHYIRVDMGEDKTIDYFSFGYKTRNSNGGNEPKKILIEGSNDGTKYYEITTLTGLPAGTGVTYTSESLGGQPYRYLRFMVNETTNGSSKGGHQFFALASFNLNKVSVTEGREVKTLVYNSLSHAIEEAEAVIASAKSTEDDISAIQSLLQTINAGLEVHQYPFTLTKNANEPICYFIKSGRSKDWSGNYYWTFKDGKVTTVTANDNYEKDVEAYWFFMENPQTGMLQFVPFIENMKPMGYTTVGGGANKLTNNAATSGFVGTDYTLVTETANADYGSEYPYALKAYGTDYYVSNHGGSGSTYMGFYDGLNDGGTRIAIEKAEITPSAKLRDLRAALASCPDVDENNVRDELGYYNVEKYNEYKAIVEPARATYEDATLTDEQYQEKIASLSTDPTTLLVVNRPETERFYRFSHDFGGDVGNLYIQAKASNVESKANAMLMSAENGASSIFYYADAKLLSYSEGLYVNEGGSTRGLQSVGSTAGAAKFEPGTVIGQLGVFSGDSFHANSSGNVRYIDHCGSVHSAEHDFTVEDVTSLPFTFKKAALGFATFNAPVAVELPEGVIAYVAQIVGESTLKMRKFISEDGEPVVVPANTPVMLYKENVTADTQISLDIVEDTYSDEELAEIDEKNDFVGTVAAENLNAEKECYSLQVNKNDQTKVGFYNKTTGTKGGFKAWLETDKAEGVRAFTIIFDGDDATGLKEALGLENENVEIYDLSGRRLDKPVKGVNVIGGKLVIK